MVTRDVTIKALVRLAGDVSAAWYDKGDKGLPAGDELAAALEKRFQRLSELPREFRREGFYERFPTRSQVERVEKIRRRFDREIGIAV